MVSWPFFHRVEAILTSAMMMAEHDCVDSTHHQAVVVRNLVKNVVSDDG
jgi:hypothetical protein